MKTYTIQLNDNVAQRLERLACIEGVDINLLIARALTSEEFILEQQLKGRTIYLQHHDSQWTRVSWPQKYPAEVA
jgi:predicted transcriptional regulator